MYALHEAGDDIHDEYAQRVDSAPPEGGEHGIGHLISANRENERRLLPRDHGGARVPGTAIFSVGYNNFLNESTLCKPSTARRIAPPACRAATRGAFCAE